MTQTSQESRPGASSGNGSQIGKRQRVVRPQEMPRFYHGLLNLPNPVARDCLRLLLFTGLRRREATSLRWEHVDFAPRIIRLPAANTKAGESSTCR